MCRVACCRKPVIVRMMLSVIGAALAEAMAGRPVADRMPAGGLGRLIAAVDQIRAW